MTHIKTSLEMNIDTILKLSQTCFLLGPMFLIRAPTEDLDNNVSSAYLSIHCIKVHVSDVLKIHTSF